MDTGRLVVYLMNQDGNIKEPPILVKADNVRGDDNRMPFERLVDSRDRCGGTAMQAVALGGTQVEAASFLVKNRASLDIGPDEADAKFFTARDLVQWGVMLPYITDSPDRPVDGILRMYAQKAEKREKKNDELTGKCANCGVGEKAHECTGCFSADVMYCGAACQRSHWKAHKGDCRGSAPIELQPEEVLTNRTAILFAVQDVLHLQVSDDSLGGYNPPPKSSYWARCSG